MTDTPPGAPADDLDGHALEELVGYLDRGRTPYDASIEASPACRIALAGLERLRGVAGTLLTDDVADAPSSDGWMTAVLDRIALEARPGRRFPVPGLPVGTEAVVTEGALRGLVRAIGDSVPGLLTGRVRISPQPDLEHVDLEVELGVVFGTVIEEATAELRRRIVAALPRQAPFVVGRLDLRVRDVLEPPEADR